MPKNEKETTRFFAKFYPSDQEKYIISNGARFKFSKDGNGQNF